MVKLAMSGIGHFCILAPWLAEPGTRKSTNPACPSIQFNAIPGKTG